MMVSEMMIVISMTHDLQWESCPSWWILLILVYVIENAGLQKHQVIVSLKMRRSPEKGVKWNQKVYQVPLLVAVHRVLCFRFL